MLRLIAMREQCCCTADLHARETSLSCAMSSRERADRRWLMAAEDQVPGEKLLWSCLVAGRARQTMSMAVSVHGHGRTLGL